MGCSREAQRPRSKFQRFTWQFSRRTGILEILILGRLFSQSHTRHMLVKKSKSVLINVKCCILLLNYGYRWGWDFYKISLVQWASRFLMFDFWVHIRGYVKSEPESLFYWTAFLAGLCKLLGGLKINQHTPVFVILFDMCPQGTNVCESVGLRGNNHHMWFLFAKNAKYLSFSLFAFHSRGTCGGFLQTRVLSVYLGVLREHQDILA
jgi:hypothetical protein